MSGLRPKVIQLFLLSLFSISLSAQDIHFSQFEASQMFLNPALTAQYYGDWSFGIHHRKQWKSIADPFISNTVFYDKQFFYYDQQINGGIIWITDRAGSSKLTSTKVMISIAYPIRRGRSTITIGVQPGLVSRFFDNELSYPSQFNDNNGHFDPSLANVQNGTEESLTYGKGAITYFDLNAGLNWQMNLPKLKPSFGLALFHITQPSESFYDTGNNRTMRYVVHGNARMNLKKGTYLKPGFQYQGIENINMLNIGVDIGKVYKDKDALIQELFAGIYYRSGYSRNQDAIYPIVGFRYNNWRFGMSYDLNISNLKVATESKGAYELSIVYIAPSTIPRHTTIPCERF